MTTELAPIPKPPDEQNALLEYVLNLIGSIPTSVESAQVHPAARARSVANSAAVKAAITSGGLALPPGPFGWLTVVPDIVAIWKIQAQMVADIASLHGKSQFLTRENMLYCMFRHSAAHAVRELVVQVGERYLIQRVSLKLIQSIVKRIGVRLSQKVIGEAISRWLPIVGAIGVGAFAFYDTAEVARTATQLFQREILISTEAISFVSLKAFNGMYVCSDFDKGAILVANRAQNLDWERFKIVRIDKGAETVGLLSATQNWWCCDGDRSCQIMANREKLELWETYKIERAGDGEIALRAHNGRLVYVDAERGHTLWADRDVSGPATVFGVEYLMDEGNS